MSSSNYFAQKIVIISGAASGLGRALCLELLAYGAKLFALDINVEALAKLQAELPAAALSTHVADVGNRRQLEEILGQIIAQEKRIDFIFNNAGIVIGGEMQEMSWEQWDKIMNTNEWGVLNGSHLAYAQMLRQGFGHIINTSSMAGLVPVANSAAYTCSKYAVTGFTLALAEEAQKYQIHVSLIVPGALDTGIFHSAINLKQYNYEKKMQNPLIQKMSPAAAASFILKKIAQKKRLIIVPRKARLLLVLYRLLPRLSMSLMRRIM